MNIKIDKQLNRPDLGIISPGSIANCNPIPIEGSKTIVFPIRLFTSQEAQDKNAQTIPSCVEFPKYKLIKKCSDVEWDKMNDDAGAGALIIGWYQIAIDDAIGKGFTEIIQ